MCGIKVWPARRSSQGMTTDMVFSGLRALVVGLAREGSAVARFLAEHGAHVTVTDAQPADTLAPQTAALQDLDITYRLGGHPEALLDRATTDVLVVSPGVPLTIPFLQQANDLGLLLTTESRLFCQLCPAPIIGISGSSGKTTTTTLVGLMLEAAGFTTHVGGNIGQPLISSLMTIQPTDWVVMELSSFQLEYFHRSPVPPEQVSPRIRRLLLPWSPNIGALLNITPNHLDRHGDMAAYTHAKQSLVSGMTADQTAVLGFDNPATRNMAEQVSAPVRWFSYQQRVNHGTCIVDDHIALVDDDQVTAVCPVNAIKLRGQHNVYNVLAACAISHEAGVPIEAMASVATSFTGVAHRLEYVATRHGVAYYNDSIATSPERLVAALNAFDESIILLAGGKDKDLPWDEAAQLIVKQVKHLILFGHAADLIEAAVRQALQPGASLSIYRANTLDAAVAQAQSIAQSGDIVVLSPGGTSFDAYFDYVERGEHFRQLVTDKN